MALEKTHESPLDCKEIKQANPKGNHSWIFIVRTDAEAEAPMLWPPDEKSWLIGKDPDAGKDWRQEEKRMTEDEMVGWHHWLHGHEFEQALRVGDEQGSQACCSPLGGKESDTTERLNWTELISVKYTSGILQMKFKYHKLPYIRCTIQCFFSICTQFYNHHHHLIPERFYHHRNSVYFSCHPHFHFLPAPGNLLCRFSFWRKNILFFLSLLLLFSHSVVSNYFQPHGLQHSRLFVLHHLPGFAQTHVHWIGDATQTSHLLQSPSPPAFNLFQHHGLFQWVSSSHQVAEVLEFQLQHQSFQWIFRTDFLPDRLVRSPCCPNDSQESSPTLQFKSINSLMLSFLYSPTLTSIHNYWKNHCFD